MTRRIHMGGKVSELGVSALCSRSVRPRPINLRFATWTNRAEAVTCDACKLRLSRIAKANATAVEPIMCAQCNERPAVCIGLYDGEHRDSAGRFAETSADGSCDPKLQLCSDSVDQPACDECCGHGNEDGHCHPITTVIA